MRSTYPTLALLLAWLLSMTPAAHGAPETLPAADEIHQQFNDGKYREAIRAISRVMASRDWSAKKVDRYDLLTLKGECHLHLKETALAMSAFEVAAKETKDPASAGIARATAYLIKHCVGTHFVPKATASQHVAGQKPQDRPTIDILENDGRKDAFTTLWTDENNAIADQIKEATDGKSVQAVIDSIPLLARLHDFDFAAHGNDDETRKMVTDVSTHGRELLTAMEEKMGVRADVIYGKAMAVESFKQLIPRAGGYDQQDRWRKHGMEGKEPAEIKDILTTSEKIGVAGKLLTQGFATDADFYAKIIKEAKRIHERADKVLSTNFGQIYFSREAASE